MAGSLQDQLSMFNYWVEKKGLDSALNDYAPDVANDPAVKAARIQMHNAENALLARVKELQDEHLEDD